jgi:hypothetical protein
MIDVEATKKLIDAFLDRHGVPQYDGPPTAHVDCPDGLRLHYSCYVFTDVARFFERLEADIAQARSRFFDVAVLWRVLGTSGSGDIDDPQRYRARLVLAPIPLANWAQQMAEATKFYDFAMAKRNVTQDDVMPPDLRGRMMTFQIDGMNFPTTSGPIIMLMEDETV